MNDPALPLAEPPRSWLDRWFGRVKLPRQAADSLADAQRRGCVVYAMRRAGVLNFLYLSWLARRLDLAPVQAAPGLRGLVPALIGVRRSRQALEQAIARGDSAVVFLAGAAGPDPFPLLPDLQRRTGRPIFLVPALLVWSRRPQKLKPNLGDILFGAPEAPNRLFNAASFLWSHRRAFLRLGLPIDVSALLRERPEDSDPVAGRKLRGALHLHLAREFRAAVGPPIKSADRVREQVLRDRGLRRALEREAAERGAAPDALLAEARADLAEIASRFSPGFIEIVRPVLAWFFRRTYDSVEVDEAGLERLRRAAAEAPLVLCPSHKSHVDYLCLSWLFYENGLTPPHVAAGINLAFWPFGRIARAGGAFFIRRTVKGDRVYTAVLRAYVKQLLRDRFPQEFFLEGGRSRTGKLLSPRTGLFSMLVDAWLEGAAPDVLFVPVAVDYENLMEAGSYARELAGGEKRKEDLRGLWKARKVLGRKYGRLYVQLGEPVSLKRLAEQRLGAGAASLSPDEVMPSPEARPGREGAAGKRALVQHLANRMAWGISEVVTVTPVGLLAAALLSHPRRGISGAEVAQRVELLRRLAAEGGARLGRGLEASPADPRLPGVLADAMARLEGEGLVRAEEAAGEVIYAVPEERRPLLDYHRNAVLHRYVALSMVAAALRSCRPWAPPADVRERAFFLSRLLKLEFTYRAGAEQDGVFEEQLGSLERLGAAAREGRGLVAGGDRDALDFLADLTRPALESYRVAAEALGAAFPADEPSDRRALLRLALDRGRAAFLAGRLSHREALSKATLENAVEWMVQQGAVRESDGKLRLSPDWRDGRAAEHLAAVDLLLR